MSARRLGLMAGLLLASIVLASAPASLCAENTFSAGGFTVRFGQAGVESLMRTGDKYPTDYIEAHRALGHVRIVYRMGDNPWREFSTADAAAKRRAQAGVVNGAPELFVIYNESEWNDYFADVEVGETFRIEGDALYWSIHVRNLTHKPLELGDVVLPLPFNTDMRWDKTISYTQRVVTHGFVSGHGSFFYWMRPNKEGPFLVMTPVAACPEFESVRNERNFKPAKLEYQDRRGVYIHSKVTGEAASAKGGNWRQPHTSHLLSPKFSPNDEVTYAFKFRWAADEKAVRDVLVEEGLFDVNVVPGMTVPVDLEARVAVRTRNAKYAVEPEFPDKTAVADLGEREKGTRIYKVKFSRLGENLLRLKWGREQSMVLEFFVTEPLETLVKKRSAFLVSHQQHRDPAKWYNGLFSEWDMKAKVLRGPDDLDGLLDYVVNCDDPGLCKAPYVAAKNVHYPDAGEIAAVEYYIRNFVWGGLQQTDREPYPYGVYGIDTWKKNRDSGPADRDGWTGHLWRVYDYPHVINLYLSMHRIAERYPGLVKDLDARGYLERAYGTTVAYYTWPLKLAGWPAEDLGTMDECVIPEVIDELEAAGMTAEAARVRTDWERTIARWVNDGLDVFYSEFPFDPTGFEAYGAFVHYGMKALAGPSPTLRVTPADLGRFTDESIAGNTTTRGCLEPAYWQLGVEGDLRYMSQMGGWALVDYALHFAKDPAWSLRLGYASFLSSWCLMNTGTPETGYGYWWPGPENDGAAGSAFLTEAYGTNWLGKSQKRGAWQYGAEIDLGFGGALRTAATIVTDDPLFGLMALGGDLVRDGKKLSVVPKDGLRKRFHALIGGRKLHLELDRDGFAAGRAVELRPDLAEAAFDLENRTADDHTTVLKLWGTAPGTYEVLSNGARVGTAALDSLFERTVPVPVAASGPCRIVVRRLK